MNVVVDEFAPLVQLLLRETLDARHLPPMKTRGIEDIVDVRGVTAKPNSLRMYWQVQKYFARHFFTNATISRFSSSVNEAFLPQLAYFVLGTNSSEAMESIRRIAEYSAFRPAMFPDKLKTSPSATISSGVMP